MLSETKSSGHFGLDRGFAGSQAWAGIGEKGKGALLAGLASLYAPSSGHLSMPSLHSAGILRGLFDWNGVKRQPRHVRFDGIGRKP